MKPKTLFFLPLFIFSFWSCEKQEMVAVEEIALSAAEFPASISAQEAQEIIVKITTGTPCYSIDVEKTISGKTFEYNFILTEQDGACIQVVKEHNIPVVFDPPAAGTYTLRFLIDGKLHETREIIVTENPLVDTWQVLRFENEIENTVTSSPEGEDIVITFAPSGFEGTTERNEFEGKYQIQDKNQILITDYVTTEQLETEFGKRFYEALGSGSTQALSFEIKEDLLKIVYEEGKFMVLKRV